jgi:hypothetical protein
LQYAPSSCQVSMVLELYLVSTISCSRHCVTTVSYRNRIIMTLDENCYEKFIGKCCNTVQYIGGTTVVLLCVLSTVPVFRLRVFRSVSNVGRARPGQAPQGTTT